MNTLFFNSDNKDRVYNAESFRTWLRSFFTNGIFKTEAVSGYTPFQMNAPAYYHSDRRIVVVGGFVHINGATHKIPYHNSYPGSVVLEVPAGGAYPRIDNIVIEYNENEDTRDIVLKIEQGEYSGATPYPPEPKRSLGIYQLIIGQVYVAAGGGQITNNDITDCRNDSSKCGYVECTITGKTDVQIAAEFTTYMAQFGPATQTSFNTWFNAMKSTLNDKYIGRLTTKANSVNNNITTKIGTKPSQISWYENMIDQRIDYLEQQGSGGSGDSKVDFSSGDYSVKKYPNNTINNFVRLGAGISEISWRANIDCGRQVILSRFQNISTYLMGRSTRFQIDIGSDNEYIAPNIDVMNIDERLVLSLSAGSGGGYDVSGYANTGRMQYLHTFSGSNRSSGNGWDDPINTSTAQEAKPGSVDLTIEP